MISSRYLTLVAAIALPLIPAAALSPGGSGPHHARLIEMQDVDDDGFVSLGEHSAWGAKVFQAMDSNNDGRLTRQEYMAVHMGPDFASGGSKSKMAGMRQHAQMRKAEMFQTMDDDHDGVITGGEFARELDSGFMTKDKNKDGYISADEFREWHRGW